MRRKTTSRLRAERLKWGLTQEELAPLLLIRHATQLSRIERGIRDPSIISVIAACVVFDQDLDHMFPGLQRRVHERVVAASHRLAKMVERSREPAAAKKTQLAGRIATRHFRQCR